MPPPQIRVRNLCFCFSTLRNYSVCEFYYFCFSSRYNYRLPLTLSYGAPGPNGVWSGLMGDLQKNVSPVDQPLSKILGVKVYPACSAPIVRHFYRSRKDDSEYREQFAIEYGYTIWHRKQYSTFISVVRIPRKSVFL